MDLSWLSNANIDTIYTDDRFFMRAIKYKYNSKPIYLFIPASLIIPNISQIKNQNIIFNNDKIPSSELVDDITAIDFFDFLKKITKKKLMLEKYQGFLHIIYKYKSINISMYIPIIPNMKYPHMTNPIYVDNDSRYNTIIRKMKIAELLKFFILYLYSKYGKIEYEIVGNNYNYNYEESTINKSNFINDATLKVPTQTIIPKLEQYLNIQLNTNKTIVESFKFKTITDIYTSTSDFTKTSNNVIFSDITALYTWIHNVKDQDRISITIPQTVVSNEPIEPIFYINNLLDGLCILQKVKDKSLECATYVAKKWRDEEYNIGSEYTDRKSDEPVNIFTLDVGYHSRDKSLNILYLQDSNEYIAILPLKNIGNVVYKPVQIEIEDEIVEIV